MLLKGSAQQRYNSFFKLKKKNTSISVQERNTFDHSYNYYKLL